MLTPAEGLQNSVTNRSLPGEYDVTDTDTAEVNEALDTDLLIIKVDSADPVNAGDPLTYTVTVSNAGPSDTLNVQVTDTLPALQQDFNQIISRILITTACALDPSRATEELIV